MRVFLVAVLLLSLSFPAFSQNEPEVPVMTASLQEDFRQLLEEDGWPSYAPLTSEFLFRFYRHPLVQGYVRGVGLTGRDLRFELCKYDDLVVVMEINRKGILFLLSDKITYMWARAVWRADTLGLDLVVNEEDEDILLTEYPFHHEMLFQCIHSISYFDFFGIVELELQGLVAAAEEP